MITKEALKGIITAVAISLYFVAVVIIPHPFMGTMAFIYENFIFWGIIIIPSIILMRRNKETLAGIRFSKQGYGWQVAIGIAWGIVSFVPLVISDFLGFFSMDFQAFQSIDISWFLQVLFHALLFVALVEEIVFRGHLYNAIKAKGDNIWLATLVTSVLFGLIHLPASIIFDTPINAVYIINAMIFGIVSCVMMERIKHCSMLSLIIAHALHNGILYGILV